MVSREASLTVNRPVAITQQPLNQEVTLGNQATFSVVADGTPQFSYQWRFNGVIIPGATGATLILPQVQLTDAGDYSVQVGNPVGTVLSATARLTVNVPVTITQPPQDRTVTAGGSATFSVGAGGTAPLSYQWRKDGAILPGATDATLALANVQPAQAGNYTVDVTNVAGATTSSAARLVVNVPVTFTQQPLSQVLTAGETALLAVTASGTAPFTYQWYHAGTPMANATSAILSPPTFNRRIMACITSMSATPPGPSGAARRN